MVAEGLNAMCFKPIRQTDDTASRYRTGLSSFPSRLPGLHAAVTLLPTDSPAASIVLSSVLTPGKYNENCCAESNR